MDIRENKQLLRREIAFRKQNYSKEVLHEWSLQIISRLEKDPLFQAAGCIALYDALPGEVETRPLLLKWAQDKQLLLPVVQGDDLRIFRFEGTARMRQGAFHIWEPDATCQEVSVDEIDLILVPGVAFDRACNRLGRGRGFYDRLIKNVKCLKVGICFEFQLRDTIPTEPFDCPMDLLITENATFNRQSPNA